MGVSSVASFLQQMASANLSAFDQQLTLTEWKILLALGESTSNDKMMDKSGGQSYKSLRCTCELSDDALSRGLRRLVELGLTERRNSRTDQRVMHYCLSPVGQDGILRIGRALVQQLGQLVIALSLLQTEGWKTGFRM